jgi:drug/metabolite transporter (DMT)-like permease
MPVVIVAGGGTFILQEDWTPWLHLDGKGWLAWILFSFGILLFGNLLQISSIHFLGAPMVSTLLAFRLVSALVFSAIIMKEELTDTLQFVGAFVILFTVTGYMWAQKREKK